MSLTNIKAPNGLSVNGNPISDAVITTGKVFYVHSGTGSNSYKGDNANQPLADVDAAINKCTASKMDIIVVMPGHSETLASASAITCDIAGVQIIGLGTGALRPSFSLTATDSSIVVSAADVTWKNCVFSSGVAELVLCFSVTGAGFTLDSCAVKATATSMINFLTCATLANNLTIQNCHFVTSAIPTANAYFIHGVGNDDMVLRNNFFSVLTSNHAGSGVLLTDGTLTLRMLVSENYIFSTGTSVIAIRLLTGSTGLLWNNQIGTTKTDADNVVISDGTFKFNNLTTNNLDASGFVAPAIDTAG